LKGGEHHSRSKSLNKEQCIFNTLPPVLVDHLTIIREAYRFTCRKSGVYALYV